MTEQNSDYGESLGITEEEIMEMGRVGAVFYEQGNIENALQIFEGLVELQPDNGNAHAALGAVLTLRKDDQKATRHLEKAIELEPNQIAPYVNLGEVYVRQQKLEQALMVMKKAIELDPDENDYGANRARSMIMGIYKVLESQQGN